MKVSFDNEEILSAIDRVAKKTMTMDLAPFATKVL